VHFNCQERKKETKKHKQSITGGYLTIIYLAASQHMKESTTAHPVRWRMTRFDHKKASHAPP
jgi:hypothetical protein